MLYWFAVYYVAGPAALLALLPVLIRWIRAYLRAGTIKEEDADFFDFALDATVFLVVVALALGWVLLAARAADEFREHAPPFPFVLKPR